MADGERLALLYIAGKPWKKIKADDLQQAINALITCGYSWSTIKKAYDKLV